MLKVTFRNFAEQNLLFCKAVYVYECITNIHELFLSVSTYANEVGRLFTSRPKFFNMYKVCPNKNILAFIFPLWCYFSSYVWWYPSEQIEQSTTVCVPTSCSSPEFKFLALSTVISSVSSVFVV